MAAASIPKTMLPMWSGERNRRPFPFTIVLSASLDMFTWINPDSPKRTFGRSFTMKRKDINELITLIRMYCARAWDEGYAQGQTDAASYDMGGKYQENRTSNPYDEETE